MKRLRRGCPSEVILLLGGSIMNIWLQGLLSTIVIMLIVLSIVRIVHWIVRSKRPSLYIGIFIFLFTYVLIMIAMIIA